MKDQFGRNIEYLRLSLTERCTLKCAYCRAGEGACPKTKELSAQINTSRLSFASPEHMEKYLDISPGAVSAAGLMNDTSLEVNLLVDEDLLKSENIVIHPCVNTSSVMLKTADLFEKFVPYTKHKLKTVSLIGE